MCAVLAAFAVLAQISLPPPPSALDTTLTQLEALFASHGEDHELGAEGGALQRYRLVRRGGCDARIEYTMSHWSRGERTDKVGSFAFHFGAFNTRGGGAQRRPSTLVARTPGGVESIAVTERITTSGPGGQVSRTESRNASFVMARFTDEAPFDRILGLWSRAEKLCGSRPTAD